MSRRAAGWRSVAIHRVAITASALAAGCVTSLETEADEPALLPAISQQSIVIPIGTTVKPEERALAEFYDSLLARMRSAYVDGDLAMLRQLLADYRRDDVPEWAQGRLAHMDGLAHGLLVEQHWRSTATIELTADQGSSDEIGAPLVCTLVLTGLPDQPLQLGGAADADPVAFGVAVAVRDAFIDGSRRYSEVNEVIRLPASTVVHGEPLRLPVLLALDGSGAVRRELTVRVDLLPGYVATAGVRAPVRRTPLAATKTTQWPGGHRAIRERPLETLRAALRLGDPAHFPHVWLAAVFAPAEARPQVEQLLIDQVRLGRADQAQVAMVALRDLGVADLPPERERWLAWWQSRR